MAETTIKLSGDLEAFVNAQVESGAYATPEDVVRAGLEALKEASDDLTAWERENFDDLKKKIDEGMADFEAGRIHTYEKPGDLARDIKREGRRLFRERQAAVEQNASSSVQKRAATSQKSTPGSRRTKIS